jgi:hypothetical protein
LALAALAAACGCNTASAPAVGPDARRELERAGDAATEWITRSRTRVEVDLQTAVATGYLERLRLGFGSPFRLAEYALNDPRLADTLRTRVAWAILGRTLARDAYQVDPIALDRISLRRVGGMPGTGRLHLDLIDGVVRQSGDPRSGELAVRLAYSLAAAAGDLGRAGPDAAVRAAALIRDRELAYDDVTRLLRAAADSSMNALSLMQRWRAERRFDVERPAMAPLDGASELHAMELAPRLAQMIRVLSTAPSSSRGPLAGTLRRPASLLGNAAAERLRDAADSLHAPPETPVAVATMVHRDEIIDPPWVPADERVIREQFVNASWNAERFAAQYALISTRSVWDAGPATAALAAAVALRSFAQEPVWFPGFGGPSLRELQERWGLGSVSFDDGVPAAWRPYYRRVLDLALADLSRVLPALDIDGLAVHYTGVDRRDQTLALHDPRRRRLILPPVTATGTLAHEIAHDLDWQVALRRYRVRGDYASDRAVRIAGDRFAERLQELTGAMLRLAAPGDRTGHANRPAEVFARNLDWFVVASLAARDRTNGYLSSVQDDMLTGYGSVRPPDITGAAGHALVRILDEVAPLYPDTRAWFVSHYGLTRALTPYDLVRRVLEAVPDAPSPQEPADAFGGFLASLDRFEEVEHARDAGFTAIDEWICAAPGASFHQRHEFARRELVMAATRARARALALQIARRVSGRSGERWVAARLDDEPGPTADELDPAVLAALQPIVERARQAITVDLPQPAARIAYIRLPEHCTAGPLHIQTPRIF